MDRFALFQLPYVACSEVMKMFSLFEMTNNKIVTIFNGLEVKQNDGLKTATISINDDPLNEFGRFWMIVWDTFEF
uniref:F-box domain-containing protein n=1 Tax=Caenorhabditis tropicalis TaxID=1561998 RepID=A0A1I7UIN0_9PELO